MATAFVVNTTNVDTYTGILIILSSVGGIISIIISSAMFANIVYEHIQIHKKSIETNKPFKGAKISNILLLSYLIIGILLNINYVIIRSNTFIKTSSLSFNETRCEIGWYLTVITIWISKGLLFILFLHRIKTVFQDSAYQYDIKIYIALIVFVIIASMVGLCGVLWIHWNSSNRVWYNDETGTAFCGDDGSFNFGWIFAISYEIIVNSILLFMFCKGLYSLHKALVFAHKSLMNVLEIKNMESCEEKKRLNDNEKKVGAIQNNVPFHTMLSKYDEMKGYKKPKRNASMKMMIKLHHLIKKQTILVIIVVISSMILWINTIFVDDWFSVLITWDILINGICCWLMMSSSNPYWLWCAKKGCLRCCYKRLNDTVL